jgi:uncharacterized protein YodC (DUF2158 family)
MSEFKISDEIKVGATVKLRSGGPVMTIGAIEDRNGMVTAVCSWFASGIHGQADFPIGVLIPATPKER